MKAFEQANGALVGSTKLWNFTWDGFLLETDNTMYLDMNWPTFRAHQCSQETAGKASMRWKQSSFEADLALLNTPDPSWFTPSSLPTSLQAFHTPQNQQQEPAPKYLLVGVLTSPKKPHCVLLTQSYTISHGCRELWVGCESCWELERHSRIQVLLCDRGAAVAVSLSVSSKFSRFFSLLTLYNSSWVVG